MKIIKFKDGLTKEARFTCKVCEVVPCSNQNLPLDEVCLFVVVVIEIQL